MSEAFTWLDFDDASLGRAVKACGLALIETPTWELTIRRLK